MGTRKENHCFMSNHGKTFCLLMSVCFIAATSTAVFAQTGKCSFQQLTFPAPATNGQAVALNDSGAIAGQYFDSKSVSHGFLLYQGKLTSFMFPGSISTGVSDMSSNGIIVGGYTTEDGKGHAYMVHAGGFHEITLPGFPNAAVTVAGVNSNGDIVGNFTTDNVTAPGFLLHNGKLTIISFPGATGGTVPTSINDEGVVVGGFFINLVNTNPAFMWKDGVFSNIKPPDSVPTPFVNATKITNSGAVVGTYEPESGGDGFAFKNGIYTKIGPPAGFEDMSILAGNKFDNILIQATQLGGPVGKTFWFKGFCGAAF
jgi:uncharacterized membrane protein